MSRSVEMRGDRRYCRRLTSSRLGVAVEWPRICPEKVVEWGDSVIEKKAEWCVLSCCSLLARHAGIARVQHVCGMNGERSLMRRRFQVAVPVLLFLVLFIAGEIVHPFAVLLFDIYLACLPQMGRSCYCICLSFVAVQVCDKVGPESGINTPIEMLHVVNQQCRLALSISLYFDAHMPGSFTPCPCWKSREAGGGGEWSGVTFVKLPQHRDRMVFGR